MSNHIVVALDNLALYPQSKTGVVFKGWWVLTTEKGLIYQLTYRPKDTGHDSAATQFAAVSLRNVHIRIGNRGTTEIHIIFLLYEILYKYIWELVDSDTTGIFILFTSSKL
jgi:hypothetical protein